MSSGTSYPPLPSYGSQGYDDPAQHEISRSYQPAALYSGNDTDASQSPPPSAQQGQLPQLGQLPQQAQTTPTSEAKPRLRKACDSCSIRKVKCDESGPPCRSCAALEIPCTFARPSRRRGPPNRHAEAIKRQKISDNGSYTSPTHDAALSLAALASPVPLSAELICDIGTLRVLVDDYFTYIHPLVPIPHEPTFRDAFERREDTRDSSFLALFAAMLEVLVASFPRRPRQVLTSEEARKKYPTAGALIDRCHQVYNDARGIGFLDRSFSLHDACGSYLSGLAAGYLFDQTRNTMYFAECVMILRRLGYTKAERDVGATPGVFQFAGEQPGLETTQSYIDQECGRRLFWLCFVGCQSIRQLGAIDADLLMPPMSHNEQLPPLPREVDDEYIFSFSIEPQPSGTLSLLAGFNLNAMIFRAFHALTALEMAFGRNELYDFDRQRQIIRQALAKVKSVTEHAPLEFQINLPGSGQAGSGSVHEASDYSNLLNGRQHPMSDRARSNSYSVTNSRRGVQFEIQKANIYATQLATRSYLVEKYWNLYEIRESRGGQHEPALSVSDGSPTAGALASGFDQNYITRGTPSDLMDAGEQYMAVEREKIVRDLGVVLRSINQVAMEPNGLSLTHKIRQVASTLLDTKRTRMSHMPTLDSDEVNTYLLGFLDILAKLERIGSGRLRSTMAATYDAQGNFIAGPTVEDLEEEELVQWASLKDHQERFVKKNGFVGAY